MPYRFLADVTVAVHVAWVAFVVFSLPLILIGGARGWAWVGNRWFRGIHLAMISLVIVRALIWEACPLTWWEADLRELAGQVDFEGSPVGWFLHRLIHPVGVPMWVYPVVYTLFGLLVFATLWFVPVRWKPGRKVTEGHHEASNADPVARDVALRGAGRA